MEARSDVYSYERNLSNLSQPLVGGTYFAFFGAAKRGPVDDWYFYSDPDLYLADFDLPDSSIGYFHTDVLQAFDEGASGVWVRRVAAADATFGGLVVQNKDVSGTRTLSITNSGCTVRQNTLTTALTAWGTPSGVNDNVLAFVARGPSSQNSKIAIEIVSPNLIKPTVTGAVQIPIPAGSNRIGKFTDALVYNYFVTAYTARGETAPSTVQSCTFAAGAGNVNAQQPIAVNLTALVPGALGYKVYRTVGAGAIGTAVLVGTMLPTSLQFVDYNDGTYVNTVPPVASTIPVQDWFTVNVYDDSLNTKTPQETFEVSLKSRTNSAGAQTLIEAVMNREPGQRNGSGFVSVQNATAFMSIIPTITSLPKTYLAAGGSGSAITSSDIIPTLKALTDKEKYDIAGISDSGFSTVEVQQAIATTITNRGRGIAIFNVPSAKQAAPDAVNYARSTLGISGDRLAISTPDHYVQDSYNRRQEYVPPSGKLAGLLAFTDRIRNPGWSPAGYQRGIVNGTIKLRHNYTKEECNLLAEANVNYFTTERLYGTVLREAYTLTPEFSALSFIPVRRILDVAEETAEKLLKFYLHEPNNDILSMQIISRLNDLYGLMKGAQMIGNFTVIDKTTSVQRSQGNRFIYSLIEPLIPTVRIAHTTVVTQQGVSFDTVIQQLGV